MTVCAIRPLPCPFCGLAPVLRGQTSRGKYATARVACKNCQFEGPGFKILEDAVKHWNRRIGPAPVPARGEG